MGNGAGGAYGGNLVKHTIFYIYIVFFLDQPHYAYEAAVMFLKTRLRHFD